MCTAFPRILNYCFIVFKNVCFSPFNVILKLKTFPLNSSKYILLKLIYVLFNKWYTVLCPRELYYKNGSDYLIFQKAFCCWTTLPNMWINRKLEYQSLIKAKIDKSLTWNYRRHILYILLMIYISYT